MWESIRGLNYPNLTHTSHRLKVPGGWLVRETFSCRSGSPSGEAAAVTMSLVLVTDPEHKWELEKMESETR